MSSRHVFPQPVCTLASLPTAWGGCCLPIPGGSSLCSLRSPVLCTPCQPAAGESFGSALQKSDPRELADVRALSRAVHVSSRVCASDPALWALGLAPHTRGPPEQPARIAETCQVLWGVQKVRAVWLISRSVDAGAGGTLPRGSVPTSAARCLGAVGDRRTQRTGTSRKGPRRDPGLSSEYTGGAILTRALGHFPFGAKASQANATLKCDATPLGHHVVS